MAFPLLCLANEFSNLKHGLNWLEPSRVREATPVTLSHVSRAAVWPAGIPASGLRAGHGRLGARPGAQNRSHRQAGVRPPEKPRRLSLSMRGVAVPAVSGYWDPAHMGPGDPQGLWHRWVACIVSVCCIANPCMLIHP